MKRNYIVKFIVMLVVILSIAACGGGDGNKPDAQQHSEAAHEYTCPMHPQVVLDKPGTCPICGMDLVPRTSPETHGSLDSGMAYLLKPVNEQVLASIPVVKARQGSNIHTIEVAGRITYDTRNQTSIASRVSGRIERLYIKYNYQPVKKGQLIMEIYSPDLAAAQRELLFIDNNGKDGNLLLGAKQRLILLGMRESEIAKILRTGKISYRVPIYSNVNGFILETASSSSPNTSAPASMGASSADGMNNMAGSGSSGSNIPAPPSASSAPTPVLLREGQYVGAGESIFTIYQTKGLVAEFSLNPKAGSQIHKNAKVLIQRTANSRETFTGTIGLIQPMFSAGDNFTQARVYLQNKNLSIGELVVGHIPIVTDKGWWLPKEAVLSLGNKTVVFKKEGKVLVPREITIGASDKKQIQVTDNIGDWEIAKNAYYLVDSESFIKVKKEK